MCFMCQLTGRGAGDDEEEERAGRVDAVLNAIRAHTGNRAWFHGFLMQYRYDVGELIALAEMLKVSPEPFAVTMPGGERKIADWPAVYEAVVDRATEVLSRNVDTPEAAKARGLGQLLEILVGRPETTEGRWLYQHQAAS